MHRRIIVVSLCCFFLGQGSPALSQTTRTSNSPSSEDALIEQLAYLERLGRAAVDVAKRGAQGTELIRELERSEKLDARRCFAACEFSVLVGTPQAALPLLERLLRENPEEKVPGIDLPVAVVAHFRIGTAARYSGQLDRAHAAYEASLEAVKGMQGRDRLKSGLAAIAMLYMAEIEVAQDHREQAIKTLERIGELPKNQTAQGLAVDVYKEWAQANLDVLRSGKPGLATKARTIAPVPWMMMSFHLGLSGLNDLSELGRHGNGGVAVDDRLLEMVSQSASSRIDKNLAQLVRAHAAAIRGDHETAHRLFASGMEEPGFLSLDYGAGMIRCLIATGQVDAAKKVLDRVAEQSPKAGERLKGLLRPEGH